LSVYWPHHSWHRHLMDGYGFRVVAEPTVEPVGIEEARSHLRIETFGSPAAHPDDEIIESLYIPAAREWCEFYSGQLLATQTVELALDAFPGRASRFYLPIGPVQSVSSVTYLDAAGVEQTMVLDTDYSVRAYNGRASIYLPDGVAWPTPMTYRYGERAVFVRYVAGYQSESPVTFPVPRSARAAILLVLGHLYENRENSADRKFEEIPLGAAALLDRDRVRLGFA
jgi:uncharacterized phiE125 gp8 family phage protein